MTSAENEQNFILSILENLDNYSIEESQVVDSILKQMENQNKVKVNMLVKQTICKMLNLQMESVSMEKPLSDYGVDSVVFMDIYRRLKLYFKNFEFDPGLQNSTLQNIADEFENQVDDETLNTIDLENIQDEYGSGSSLLDLGLTGKNNYPNVSENDINDQRQQIFKKLKKMSQSELRERGLTKNDAVLPDYETFDLMVDDRNCIWIFSKTSIFSQQATDELISFHNKMIEEFDLEKIGILYYTHHGVHFSLGGDRLFYAEGSLHEDDKFRQWFESVKLHLNVEVPEEYPLVVSVCAGTAQGGGLEYLIKSDFQFVLPQAKLGVPDIKSNSYAGMGAVSYLATQIGLARTKLLNITGGLIYGHQAYEMGLISHLSLNPFRDAYYFCDMIPDIKIAKHINYLLNQQYIKIRNRDVDDWFQVVKDNIGKGYNKILEDYRAFNFHN